MIIQPSPTVNDPTPIAISHYPALILMVAADILLWQSRSSDSLIWYPSLSSHDRTTLSISHYPRPFSHSSDPTYSDNHCPTPFSDSNDSTSFSNIHDLTCFSVMSGSDNPLWQHRSDILLSPIRDFSHTVVIRHTPTVTFLHPSLTVLIRHPSLTFTFHHHFSYISHNRILFSHVSDPTSFSDIFDQTPFSGICNCCVSSKDAA